jgi:hypothetical protein
LPKIQQQSDRRPRIHRGLPLETTKVVEGKVCANILFVSGWAGWLLATDANALTVTPGAEFQGLALVPARAAVEGVK